MIENAVDIEKLGLKLGFLPFFRCGIEGFSIEEHTPDYLWFSAEEDGPWEWKGPVIAMGSLAYGKLFRGKAGFVSLEWLPHLMNWRRSRFDLASQPDAREIYSILRQHESLISGELKKLCGYTIPGRGKSQFDAQVTRLQMATYVVTAVFEYNYTRQGVRYGWGKAVYTTPELMYGDELARVDCSPEESLELIVDHLATRLPHASREAIRRLIE